MKLNYRLLKSGINLHRYKMKKIFVILIATLPFAAFKLVKSDPGKPNVIVLLADDMRSKTIHAWGNTEIITPNLDRMAASGVSFPHAYNMGGHTGAICVASRAMLLTGRNIFDLENKGATIPASHITMPQAFTATGYQNYGIGKWHNGIDSYVRSFTGGNEIMFGGMTASQWEIPLNYFHADGKYTQTCVVPDEGNRDLPRIGDHVYKGKHSSAIFADAAIKFLETPSARKPFFMYVAFTAPHDPRQVPQEYFNMYDTAKIALPPNFLPEHPFDNGHMKGRDERLLGFPRKPGEVKCEIRDYYASITYLDAQIGRIIDALKQSGQYENTIIVFAGDNGLAVGQHGLMGKQSLYEHSVGVPMIWSGKDIPENKMAKGYVYLNEIYPTLCQMLNMKKPESVQTPGLLANILHPERDAHKMLFFAFRDLHRAVSDRRYKLIEYNVKGVRTTQLFDLVNDPWERNNLADNPKYKSIKNKLREAMLQHKNEGSDQGSPFWKSF